MIYTLSEARRQSWKCVDEYGEPSDIGTLGVMRSCWYSGIRYGVAAAFTPALMAFVAGLYHWP